MGVALRRLATMAPTQTQRPAELIGSMFGNAQIAPPVRDNMNTPEGTIGGPQACNGSGLAVLSVRIVPIPPGPRARSTNRRAFAAFRDWREATESPQDRMKSKGTLP